MQLLVVRSRGKKAYTSSPTALPGSCSGSSHGLKMPLQDHIGYNIYPMDLSPCTQSIWVNCQILHHMSYPIGWKSMIYKVAVVALLAADVVHADKFRLTTSTAGSGGINSGVDILKIRGASSVVIAESSTW